MTIGIFGGTFDPVHWGHVRTAAEIKNTLGLEKMLLIPCGITPHREQPDASAESRLAMLELAIKECPGLEIDQRELKRNKPSYSFDTLQSFHDEIPDQSFALCIGADAFVHLDTWHRWQQLFDLAHIVVAHRPGWSMATITDQLADKLNGEFTKRYRENSGALKKSQSGIIVTINVKPVDISASEIRQRCRKRESISGLVPPSVEGYIKNHRLYLQ